VEELHLTIKEICSEEELMRAMNCTPLKKGYIRLRAMFDLRNGLPRELVMKGSNVSLRTFQYWIQRFTERGIDGLIHKAISGRPRILSIRNKKQLISLIENPSKAKETHWTAVKLHGYLKEKLKVNIGYSTLVKNLHEENYNLRVPRRFPAGGDDELKKAFKIKLKQLLDDRNNEVWFEDESGIEGDPTPRRRWVKRGNKANIPYNGKHIRMNILGAVCPSTGGLFTLVFDYCDAISFQKFIDELAKDTLEQSRKKNIILVLDNASWHKGKSLNWHHIKPEFLPPYSPELNPIERFWLRLKNDFFSDFIANSPEELLNRICRAIQFYIEKPSFIISTCDFTQ
jgi:transposase